MKYFTHQNVLPMVETKNATHVVSEGLRIAIETEMQNRGIMPGHYGSIEQKIDEALRSAKAMDEFLYDMGLYAVPAYGETKNLSDRKKDFPSYFSENYQTMKLARKQQPIPSGSINIKKMQPGKDGTYQTIFASFGRPLASMVVTENRILEILFSESEECKKIRTDLDLETTWAHFLIQPDADKEEFFVVKVYRYSGGLHLVVYPLGRGRVWHGVDGDRFVVAAE